jgi:hypothetical protein
MNGEKYRGFHCRWEVAPTSPLRVACYLSDVVFSLFCRNIQERQVTESDRPIL